MEEGDAGEEHKEEKPRDEYVDESENEDKKSRKKQSEKNWRFLKFPFLNMS